MLNQPNIDHSSFPEPGDFIGDYEVLQLLGEGGMGVVFLAKQDKPIERRVALKIIKLGMDTRAVLARFLSEQQALALMDHPNIAQVYQAGTSSHGRPYFAMEFVPGLPITTYCDSHRLSTRQRLELFLQVADGVQHAHQKGVIHRDLKPSNILVMERDGRAVPKIIDFGLAKATEKTCSEETLFTEAGMLVGTPEYLSPEQASANPGDIDTRTDIYSLGVLLYELLVGSRPIDVQHLRRKGYEEIRRLICEEDLPTPTSRLSSLGHQAGEIVSQRATDLDGLRKQVRGDLEWIAMTALAKERERRYASASELAADIQRHLHDEPVMAGPPATAYRIGKFMRKNRAAVLTLAVVFASLLLGLTTSTSLYFKAERQRVEAERLRKESERERLEAERQRLEAHLQSDRANAQKSIAEKASLTADQQRKEAEAQHVEAERQRLLAEQQADEARKQGERASAEQLSAEKQRALAEIEAKRAVEQSKAADEQRATAERQRLLARRQSYVANLIAADLHIRSNEIAEARRRLNLCPPELRGWEWHYLLWSSDSSIASIPSLSTQGPGAAVAGFGAGGAGLFRASSGAFEWWAALAAKPSIIRGDFAVPLAADASGKYVVTPNGQIYDMGSGKLVAKLDGPLLKPACASMDSNGHLVLGDRDGAIEFWDIRSGEKRSRSDSHKGGVSTLLFSADGQRLLSGGEDKTLRVWDAIAAHPMYAISGHGAAVISVAWSTDRRLIVSGSADRTARSWDAATGKALHTFSGHACGVQSVAVNQEGNIVATASCQTVYLWDNRSGTLINVLHAPWQSSIASVKFSADGGLFMAASASGEIKVWDAKTYGGRIMQRADPGAARAVISADGQRIARYDAKKQLLEAWSTRDQRTLWSVPENGHINVLAFNSDSTRLAVGVSDGSVRLLNGSNGQPLSAPGKIHAPIVWLSFSPDSTRLIVGSVEQSALFDLSRPGTPLALTVPAGATAFSGDGKRLAVGQASGETSVWEVGSDKLLGVLRGHSGPVESVAFNRDGTRIVTGSRDQTIRVWDADAYEGLLVLGDQQEIATALVFSPDGSRLYSASSEGTVRVWNTKSASRSD